MSLVFDIGFNNGDDAAYYLSEGHTVVGVEANPLLVEDGRKRFASEIEQGKLILLNVGVWNENGLILPFYVNETDPGWSSFRAEWGQKGGNFKTIDVTCITLGELVRKYGTPWFVKVDVEGGTDQVLSSMTAQTSPTYLSCELVINSSTLEFLRDCGFQRFKLINQETYTDSIPILQDDISARALRKLSGHVPGMTSVVTALPYAIRPKRILWDDPTAHNDKRFSGYSSGPFPEETVGKWRNYADIKSYLDGLFARYSRLGIGDEFWYDLHAGK